MITEEQKTKALSNYQSGNYSSDDFLISIGIDPEERKKNMETEKYKRDMESVSAGQAMLREIRLRNEIEFEKIKKARIKENRRAGAKKAALTRLKNKINSQKSLPTVLNTNNPEIKNQVDFYFKLKTVAETIKEKKKTGLTDTLYLCPPDSFLEKMVSLFWTVTDIPLNMIFWTTLTSIGGYLTQLDKIIKYEAQTLYPNIWTLTLAPSGAGKSAVLDFLEFNFKNKIKIDEPNYRTKASVIADFSSDVSMKRTVIKIDEMAQNVKLFRTESGQGLKEAYLTMYGGMYGGKLNHTTKEDGKIQINDIFISIAAATALDTFQDAVKPEDLFDGFLQRFIIIIGNKKERNMKNWPYSWKEELISEIKQSFDEYTSRIKNIESFSLSEEARQIWRDYYFKHFNADLESHYKRYLWATLKIAAIYNSMLEADGIISKADILWALRAIEISLANLYEVLDKYLSFDQWERLTQRVRIYIENHPGTDDRKIMMGLHIPKKMLEIAKQNLKDREYKDLQADSQPKNKNCCNSVA